MKEYIMRYENEVLQLLPDKIQPLVRCKDCKHYNKERKWCNWLSEMYDQGEEWFCADGERKPTQTNAK